MNINFWVQRVKTIVDAIIIIVPCKGALKLLQIYSRTQKLTVQNSVPHLLISHASHKKAAAKFMHACLYVAEDHM